MAWPRCRSQPRFRVLDDESVDSASQAPVRCARPEAKLNELKALSAFLFPYDFVGQRGRGDKIVAPSGLGRRQNGESEKGRVLGVVVNGVARHARLASVARLPAVIRIHVEAR